MDANSRFAFADDPRVPMIFSVGATTGPVGAVVPVGASEGSRDWQPFDRPRLRLWHGVIDRIRGGSAAEQCGVERSHCFAAIVRLICSFALSESAGAALKIRLDDCHGAGAHEMRCRRFPRLTITTGKGSR